MQHGVSTFLYNEKKENETFVFQSRWRGSCMCSHIQDLLTRWPSIVHTEILPCYARCPEVLIGLTFSLSFSSILTSILVFPKVENQISFQGLIEMKRDDGVQIINNQAIKLNFIWLLKRNWKVIPNSIMQCKIVNFSWTLLSVTKMVEHSSVFQHLLNWGGGNTFLWKMLGRH